MGRHIASGTEGSSYELSQTLDTNKVNLTAKANQEAKLVELQSADKPVNPNGSNNVEN